MSYTKEQLAELLKANNDLGIDEHTPASLNATPCHNKALVSPKTPPAKQKPPAGAIRILEKDWERTVIELIQLHGFRVAHFRPGLDRQGNWQTAVSADGAGFPDLIAINRQKKCLIVVEDKSQKGKASDEQLEWLQDWAAVCNRVFVLRPDDYERFKEILGGI